MAEWNGGGGSGGTPTVKAREVGCGGRRRLKSSRNAINTPIYRLGGKKELVGNFSGDRRRKLLMLAGVYEFSGGLLREKVFGDILCFLKLK